ncbi:MAG: PEP-CTERM system TPR-repeat protein PrsT, partial [Gammaproteobacteria bacterium]|nr:PEP-CTERM system TPR-repeat protein PrsT [Gammaproteobacteria bacterium]
DMLQAAPGDPAIIALNGQVYAASGDQRQARIYFKQALELDQGQLSASLGLADIERKEGNLDQSIEIYKQLVKLNKGGSIPMLALAMLSAQQGDEDAMLKWLEKARESAPEDIRSRIILSNYYFTAKQYEKADLILREVVSLAPDNAETMALQGRNLIAQKRYNEALQPLKSLVAIIPRSAHARTLLGEAHARLGKISDAHEQLSQALDIDPDNVLALGLMSEIELKKGDSEKSLKHAMSLQRAQPDLYQGHKLEGDVWLSRKQYARASAAYNRAWDRQHTAALAIAMYRTSIQSLGLDSAVQPVLTWLKSNPDDTATRFFLATAYLQGNRVNAAIREYEKLLEIDPDNVAVLNNLAWLYSIENDPRALEMASRAYQSSPDVPGIQDTFGWILVQHGQLDKGIRMLSEALDQLPDNREVRYHHAAALLKSGKTGEGARLLNKLLAEDKPFRGKEDAERLLNKYNAAR